MPNQFSMYNTVCKTVSARGSHACMLAHKAIRRSGLRSSASFTASYKAHSISRPSTPDTKDNFKPLRTTQFSQFSPYRAQQRLRYKPSNIHLCTQFPQKTFLTAQTLSKINCTKSGFSFPFSLFLTTERFLG